jgi:phage tail sheath protein FI
MAEKIVSPGVFTNEKDLSFLPAGIAAIGAAIIGPTIKGPAFVPTVVTDFNDFIAKFGGLSEETYVPYAVKNYLKSASTVTVVRVLQEGGYSTGVVNILLALPVTSSATSYALSVATPVDTGSSAANLVGTSLANYTKLAVTTASIDLFDTTTLQALTFYSASTLLTVTGSVFTSASKYVALFKSESITLPSSSTTTYNATFTSYPLQTTTTKVVGTIAPTTTIGYSTNVDYLKSTLPTAAYYTTVFPMTLSGSSVTAQSFSASLLSTSNNNIKTILGTSVGGSKYGYLYNWFPNTATSGVVTFESASSSTGLNLSGSNGYYSEATTPWITSQLITGQATPNLFKVHTIAEGTNTNEAIKVSIINTQLPGQNPASDYGTFTLLIRDYADTDQRPVVLETYSGLNLDPDSANYISRRIGDKYNVIDSNNNIVTYGNYNNVSKYIWIEVDSAVAQKAISANLKPFGVTGYVNPVSSSYSTPSVSYVTQNTVINGNYNKKAYYGFDFTSTDNLNYLSPIPGGAATDTTVFNLSTCYIHPSASKADTNSTFIGGQIINDGSTAIFKGIDVSTFLKFTVGLQGGFDGMDPAILKKVGSAIEGSNLFGMNCATATSAGSAAYIKALNVLGNADSYDINLIVTPGATIANHTSIINKAIEIAEDRGDCFVIADPVIQGASAATAISAVATSGIDSSYVGTYWPWVKITDTDKNKPVWVPPSVVVPRIMAYNDSVAYEWFAPAGLNRGGITEAVDIELKLSQADRNDLYENRINAIATFPNQGVCIWGQKTLQVKPSALDRINVRRLMITLKKYIASASRYLVFENNTTATRQRFLNIVNPYLETVKARQGLYAFKVVMDETNNTPDVIDRNVMYGQIYLQPAKAAEFIVLDFNILPTGASFENA